MLIPTTLSVYLSIYLSIHSPMFLFSSILFNAYTDQTLNLSIYLRMYPPIYLV